MPQGIIKSLFKTRNKDFALIEYDNGNNMIFYHAVHPRKNITPLCKGDKVTFNIKHGASGEEAENVFRALR